MYSAWAATATTVQEAGAAKRGAPAIMAVLLLLLPVVLLLLFVVPLLELASRRAAPTSPAAARSLPRSPKVSSCAAAMRGPGVTWAKVTRSNIRTHIILGPMAPTDFGKGSGGMTDSSRR